MAQDNVEVATLCDVDNVVLKAGAKAFEEKYSKKVNIEEMNVTMPIGLKKELI